MEVPEQAVTESERGEKEQGKGQKEQQGKEGKPDRPPRRSLARGGLDAGHPERPEPVTAITKESIERNDEAIAKAFKDSQHLLIPRMRPKILVAMESVTAGVAVSYRLRKLGVMTSFARKGRDAVRLWEGEVKKKEPFDMVLIDRYMDWIGGVEFVRMVRKYNMQNRSPPVCIVAVCKVLDDPIAVLNEGFHRFVKWPVAMHISSLVHGMVPMHMRRSSRLGLFAREPAYGKISKVFEGILQASSVLQSQLEGDKLGGLLDDLKDQVFNLEGHVFSERNRVKQATTEQLQDLISENRELKKRVEMMEAQYNKRSNDVIRIKKLREATQAISTITRTELEDNLKKSQEELEVCLVENRLLKENVRYLSDKVSKGVVSQSTSRRSRVQSEGWLVARFFARKVEKLERDRMLVEDYVSNYTTVRIDPKRYGAPLKVEGEVASDNREVKVGKVEEELDAFLKGLKGTEEGQALSEMMLPLQRVFTQQDAFYNSLVTYFDSVISSNNVSILLTQRQSWGDFVKDLRAATIRFTSKMEGLELAALGVLRDVSTQFLRILEKFRSAKRETGKAGRSPFSPSVLQRLQPEAEPRRPSVQRNNTGLLVKYRAEIQQELEEEMHKNLAEVHRSTKAKIDSLTAELEETKTLAKEREEAMLNLAELARLQLNLNLSLHAMCVVYDSSDPLVGQVNFLEKKATTTAQNILKYNSKLGEETIAVVEQLKNARNQRHKSRASRVPPPRSSETDDDKTDGDRSKATTPARLPTDSPRESPQEATLLASPQDDGLEGKSPLRESSPRAKTPPVLATSPGELCPFDFDAKPPPKKAKTHYSGGGKRAPRRPKDSPPPKERASPNDGTTPHTPPEKEEPPRVPSPPSSPPPNARATPQREVDLACIAEEGVVAGVAAMTVFAVQLRRGFKRQLETQKVSFERALSGLDREGRPVVASIAEVTQNMSPSEVLAFIQQRRHDPVPPLKTATGQGGKRTAAERSDPISKWKRGSKLVMSQEQVLLALRKSMGDAVLRDMRESCGSPIPASSNPTERPGWDRSAETARGQVAQAERIPRSPHTPRVLSPHQSQTRPPLDHTRLPGPLQPRTSPQGDALPRAMSEGGHSPQQGQVANLLRPADEVLPPDLKRREVRAPASTWVRTTSLDASEFPKLMQTASHTQVPAPSSPYLDSLPVLGRSPKKVRPVPVSPVKNAQPEVPLGKIDSLDTALPVLPLRAGITTATCHDPSPTFQRSDSPFDTSVIAAQKPHPPPPHTVSTQSIRAQNYQPPHRPQPLPLIGWPCPSPLSTHPSKGSRESISSTLDAASQRTSIPALPPENLPRPEPRHSREGNSPLTDSSLLQRTPSDLNRFREAVQRIIQDRRRAARDARKKRDKGKEKEKKLAGAGASHPDSSKGTKRAMLVPDSIEDVAGMLGPLKARMENTRRRLQQLQGGKVAEAAEAAAAPAMPTCDDTSTCAASNLPPRPDPPSPQLAPSPPPPRPPESQPPARADSISFGGVLYKKMKGSKRLPSLPAASPSPPGAAGGCGAEMKSRTLTAREREGEGKGGGRGKEECSYPLHSTFSSQQHSLPDVLTGKPPLKQ